MNRLKLALLGLSFLGLSACTTSLTQTKTIGGSTGVEANYDQAYQDYLQLGAEYMRRGSYDLAEPKLKRAIEINSRSPEAWNMLALLYEQKRDIVAGQQAYQKLINGHPDYELGFVNYAIFLCKFDRQEEFQELLKKMRAKNNNFAALSYIAEGDCQHSKNNIAQAAAAYRQSLQYNDHSEAALLPLAQIELEQNNYQAAANYINVVHTYVGYSPESVRIGILAARGMGNSQEEDSLIRVMRGSYRDTEQAQSLGI